MSSGSPARDELIEQLKGELARNSALSTLFSQAVAERAGINSTDLESLDLLRREGPMTAGRLAELTGLSTGGAITALIDRLERLGYARRERDTEDRRRVLVRAMTERGERDIAPLYASLDQATNDLAARYTDEQIALLLDFTTRASEMMIEQIAGIRSAAFPASAGGSPAGERS